jgi:hypothetical protein
LESLVTSIEARPEPRAEKRLDFRSVVVFRNKDLIVSLESVGDDRVPQAVPCTAKQTAAGIVERKRQRSSRPTKEH